LLSLLVELGLDRASAEVICQERQLHGAYRLLVEVKRRTGLPIGQINLRLYVGFAV
jgi:hypothetical protein